MKISRNTPDMLILGDTPWLIGIMLILFILFFVGVGMLVATDAPLPGLLFGGFGASLGLAALAVFARRVQIILDRPADCLTIQRQSVFGQKITQRPLHCLAKAEVETGAPRRSDTETPTRAMARAVLLFEDTPGPSRLPITEAFISGGGPARIVTAINNWLGTKS